MAEPDFPLVLSETQATPTPTPNGLLTNLYAYYKLDEASGNALDASGAGLNLPNYSNPIGTTTGVINGARNWNSGARLTSTSRTPPSFLRAQAISLSPSG
jgi:hypothetical protein